MPVLRILANQESSRPAVSFLLVSSASDHLPPENRESARPIFAALLAGSR